MNRYIMHWSTLETVWSLGLEHWSEFRLAGFRKSLNNRKLDLRVSHLMGLDSDHILALVQDGSSQNMDGPFISSMVSG